jgi:hypothetical protein
MVELHRSNAVGEARRLGATISSDPVLGTRTGTGHAWITQSNADLTNLLTLSLIPPLTGKSLILSSRTSSTETEQEATASS